VGIPLLIALCVLVVLLTKRRSRTRQGSAGSAGSNLMAENKVDGEGVTSARDDAVI